MSRSRWAYQTLQDWYDGGGAIISTKTLFDLMPDTSVLGIDPDGPHLIRPVTVERRIFQCKVALKLAGQVEPATASVSLLPEVWYQLREATATLLAEVRPPVAPDGV